MADSLTVWLAQVVSKVSDPWAFFGFAAQLMFGLRFFVQWIASEKVKRSVIPEAFWYFSFGGGMMMMIWGVRQADPFIMLGQFAGLFIYGRNIYLIWKHKRQTANRSELHAAE